jgi:putative ABC transport system substrate-binding protein
MNHKLSLILAILILLPLSAAAQAGLPVIGYLGSESAAVFRTRVDSFKAGLASAGYEEGRNVLIEYRWADSRNERLPALAAELAARNVNVIAAPGSLASALAAKAATTSIPIVFETGADPVASGLIASLNRPGGNVTGITSLNAAVIGKRIELLRELVPSARIAALLVNPANAANAVPTVKDATTAAEHLGMRLQIFEAVREQEFATAFDAMARARVDMVVIANETLFNRPPALAALAQEHRLPTAHQSPEFTRAGGLMSYGGDVTESHRLAGAYVGRVLKGDKPATLPVQQVTKLAFAVNLRSARSLGLTVPMHLLTAAEEVVE